MTEIHKIVIPTPFAIGPVNVYLLTGKPLTLVDAGPNTEEAFQILSNGLEKLGYQISDLEQIIITHIHHDHFGLVGRLVKESDAKVLVHPQAVPWLENHSITWEKTVAYFSVLYRQAGLPEEAVIKIALDSNKMLAMADSAPVNKVVADGELIKAGQDQWQVIFTPGHSKTCICLYHPEKRIFLSGDHLLFSISSNPLLEPPENGELTRQPSLPVYMESLKLTAEMDISNVLPGHGENFSNYRQVIQERFEQFKCRQEKVYHMITENKKTAYQICMELFPQISTGELFLGLTEAFNHLDILVNQGEILKSRDGEVEFFYGF